LSIPNSTIHLELAILISSNLFKKFPPEGIL